MMDSALTLAVFVALALGVALVSILFYILMRVCFIALACPRFTDIDIGYEQSPLGNDEERKGELYRYAVCCYETDLSTGWADSKERA